ncbi:hypothetical protein [Paraburkholderia hospita]|uniref:hypothetical protein n=1 Tax=Paraburkholderia hospita TaxID=169430 RepID=UPI000B3421C5|nr:hypothetical protein [Paraburkholderia hospita]OUL72770.1 hypothetical protein CA603_45430 [Paraburkholderia hospita]
MNNITERPLGFGMNEQNNGQVTFAYLLSVGRQNGKNDLSLMDGYGPIIAPLLKRRSGSRFDSAEIAAALLETYGTHVHRYAIEQLVPSLATKGWLVKDYYERLSKIAVYRIADEIATEDAIDVDEVEALLEQFQTHVNSQFEKHGIEKLPRDILDGEFIKRLQQLPAVNVRLLQHAEQQEEGGNAERRTLTLRNKQAEQEQQLAEAQKTVRLNALFVSFVQELRRGNDATFQLLGRLAGSALLAEVVLNYHAPEKPADFKNVHFYLDGPLLMDLLDLDSIDRHNATRELIDSLRSAGASIRTFDHCVDEVKDNLKAAISAHKERTGYRNIGVRMKLSGEFVARANSIYVEVSRFVKDLGVAISKAPSGRQVFSHFSEESETELAARIQYGSDIAQDRDALSVSSIIRLRGSRRPSRSDFKTAQYYLLTRNNRLSSISEDYLIASDVYAKEAMPPCMTDRTLAVLLWLMRGSDDRLSISQSLLLANCAAIPTSVDAVRQTLAKLADSDKHYELARTFDVWSRTTRGIEVLTSSTMGDPTIISPENYQEIIDEVMRAAGEDAARRERELVVKELSEKDRQIASLLDETNFNKQGVATLSERAERLSEKIDELQKEGASAVQTLSTRLQEAEDARNRERSDASEKKRKEDLQFLEATIARCDGYEQSVYRIAQRALWGLALVAALVGVWIDKFSGWQNTLVAGLICACTVVSAVLGSAKPELLLKHWVVNRKTRKLHEILSLAQKGVLLEKLLVGEDGRMEIVAHSALHRPCELTGEAAMRL